MGIHFKAHLRPRDLRDNAASHLLGIKAPRPSSVVYARATQDAAFAKPKIATVSHAARYLAAATQILFEQF
jgi:hypothetical protein